MMKKPVGYFVGFDILKPATPGCRVVLDTSNQPAISKTLYGQPVGLEPHQPNLLREKHWLGNLLGWKFTKPTYKRNVQKKISYQIQELW
jgi:hypothetical protein